MIVALKPRSCPAKCLTLSTLQINPIYVFPEKELRGLSPNFHFHVSVNDLYITKIHIFSCSRIGIPIVG
jgi:hypothetical protein